MRGMHCVSVFVLAACCAPGFVTARSAAAQQVTEARRLRGAYGPYRANNDLLSYHLDVRVDPEKKLLSGSNIIRFRMLEDGTRIQLELAEDLAISKVMFRGVEAKFTRQGETFYVDAPETMRQGETYEFQVFYSGTPKETGRFGGMVFTKDTTGHPWIFTSDEDDGARVWFPNKDQWRDEPEDGVEMDVSVPNGLMDVSNGRLVRKEPQPDGYTRWHWKVTYPINNYDISLNIGRYVHFQDKPLGKLTLDFYALPEDLAKAKVQFAQARPMLQIFNRHFGEYPFLRDGYKLVEAAYTGMDHHSAVAYGNHFNNGYGGRDWTGVGISPRFDFIIIHESGHEWFGNSITAADRADMWIHEGFCTYAEDVYVQGMWGTRDAIRYVNGYRSHVRNRYPVLQERGIDAGPRDEDQYFKIALFLNTMRSVVDNDAKWWAVLHAFAEHFKYQTILTEDVVGFFDRELGSNYTALFYEYLRHADLPQLDLQFDDAKGSVKYRWIAQEPGFNMPVKAGDPKAWTVLHPTSEWQTTAGTRNSFKVATDLFYIQVVRDGVKEPLFTPDPARQGSARPKR